MNRRQPRALSPLSQRGLQLTFVLRAWCLAPIVMGGLRVVGLDRTLALLRRRRRAGRASSLNVVDGEEAVRLAFRGHPLLRGACLERALVQYLMHDRDGVEARLVIGVRRCRTELQAHAWVDEGQGEVAVVDGYRPLHVFETAPATEWVR